ncbi:MAG TPA: toll/interleukin-1 receptor domain-containing protein [Thermoanaerobaculia bacterium]
MAGIFLSHSVKDKKFLNRLARVLRGDGLSIWFSEQDIRGAAQWHDEIGAALARCDWMIVILSPAAIASRWVKREVTYAIEEPRFDGRIIPLRISACRAKDLSWVLPQIQTIDFIGRFDDACRELFAIWGIRYGKESSS